MYGFLQHHLQDEIVGASGRLFPTLEQFRAGAANYWEKGVDGLYTWMMDWPLGDAERNILTTLGSPELVHGQDKIYVVSRKYDGAERVDYRHDIPHDLSPPLPTAAHAIPFTIADDIAAADSRVSETKLRIYLSNVVSGDRFNVALNGRSLAGETCRRVWKRAATPTGTPTSETTGWSSISWTSCRTRARTSWRCRSRAVPRV